MSMASEGRALQAYAQSISVPILTLLLAVFLPEVLHCTSGACPCKRTTRLQPCCAHAERTHAWLAQAELPAEFEHSAKRAAKLKERCDSYTARMSNPFETCKAAGEGPGPSPRLPAASPGKTPNFLKRFIACITIEPW